MGEQRFAATVLLVQFAASALIFAGRRGPDEVGRVRLPIVRILSSIAKILK